MSTFCTMLLLWAIDWSINAMKKSESRRWRTAASGIETACEVVTAAVIVTLIEYMARGDF